MKANNPFNLLLPPAMAKVAEETGVYKATKHPLTTFFLAITAGVFISIAFVFYITVTTGASDLPWGLVRFIGGICFSLGLILVVVGGADLFTSTVLIVVAKASGRISWGQLARNWLTVYVGNLIGALLFVALIALAQQGMAAQGAWGLNVLQTADHKMHHSFIEAVCLGILANLMVCLGVWMSYSGRSLTDKVLVLILPVAMFVASGFEHSIANMFLIPLAIVIRDFSSPEFWQLTGASAAQFSSLTPVRFIIDNLIPVTLGNIIGGGVLVGLTYWVIYLRAGGPTQLTESKAVSESEDAP
ncbi:formate transporter FocA [Candidatus Pantoea multigeneris]|uniref:Formate transporter FocA n=1 Tax=Candidatus Pantoea multigeneris TaxID=2608357 RepID=A0ABX0RBS7_9GAMM|nr:formate transporter FocA [Pantoea multigeneris]NIF20695.1 formate transporter FocA [Pantoea multigeneris]